MPVSIDTTDPRPVFHVFLRPDGTLMFVTNAGHERVPPERHAEVVAALAREVVAARKAMSLSFVLNPLPEPGEN